MHGSEGAANYIRVSLAPGSIALGVRAIIQPVEDVENPETGLHFVGLRMRSAPNPQSENLSFIPSPTLWTGPWKAEFQKNCPTHASLLWGQVLNAEIENVLEAMKATGFWTVVESFLLGVTGDHGVDDLPSVLIALTSDFTNLTQTSTPAPDAPEALDEPNAFTQNPGAKVFNFADYVAKNKDDA